MPSALGPRNCGQHAWLEWAAAVGHVGHRVPWEAWALLAFSTLGLGLLAAQWPGFMALVVWWGCAARRPLRAWVDRVRQPAPLGLTEAWALSRRAWPRWGGWVCAAGLVLASVLLEVARQTLGLWEPKGLGLVWLVGLWVPWVFRPWGPIGFVGSLVAQGCRPLHAHRLQLSAVLQNKVSLGCLTVGWFTLLVVLLQAPWASPLAWVAWTILGRVAFLDIFQGGWSLAPQTQASPVPQKAVAASAGC